MDWDKLIALRRMVLLGPIHVPHSRAVAIRFSLYGFLSNTLDDRIAKYKCVACLFIVAHIANTQQTNIYVILNIAGCGSFRWTLSDAIISVYSSEAGTIIS